MEDLDRAEFHFREAIRLGFTTTETRLGFGIVLATRFEESQRLMLGYDPVVQASLRREARQALAAASLEQLRLARLPESPVLVKSRILAGTGNYRDAVGLLDEAVGRQPWRQDLRRLQGETLLAAYVSGFDPAPAKPWGPSFEEVQRVLEASRSWVRSDPFYWVQEGELRLARAQRREAGPTELETAADGIQDCARQALALDPDYVPALALSAKAHCDLARRLLVKLEDPSRSLDASEGICRRILEGRPDHPQAHAMLLRVAAMRLLRWPFPPVAADPAPLVKEGMEHFEAALKAMPSFSGILSYEAADLHQSYALWLLRNDQGKAALEPIARGQALIRDALVHLPQWAPAYNVRASLKQWEGLCGEDPTALLLESAKDLETCIRIDPGKAAYPYNCASRYCDLAIQRLETFGESPLEYAEKAVALAQEAQRLDPSDDTNEALVAKAKTLQLVFDLRTGRAGSREVRKLVASVTRLRPNLRFTFIPKLWLEGALAQHLRGENPESALAEGCATLAQAQCSPMGRIPLEAQAEMLKVRRKAFLGRLSEADIQAVRRKLKPLSNEESGLHEVRFCLLLARWDAAQREIHWKQARERVEWLRKMLPPQSGHARLLAAGLEMEMARGRGQAAPGWAQEELRSLVGSGSGLRQEAELFLQGRWR